MKIMLKTSLLVLLACTATQNYTLFTGQALTPAHLKKLFHTKYEPIATHNQKAHELAVKRVQESLGVFKGAVNQFPEVLINFTKIKTVCPEESLAYFTEDHGWTAYTQAEIHDMITYLSNLYITLSVPVRDLNN